MLFPGIENYLFPDNVCGIPFLSRDNPTYSDDEEECRDTNETSDLHQPLHNENKALAPPPVTEKRVRFAIDEEVINNKSPGGKRKHRNLRKCILQKSAEFHRQNDGETMTTALERRSSPPSPKATHRRLVQHSPPKPQSKRHGRRRRKSQMAAFVAYS
mmetsp:Transcript_15656/g.32164  ORF Transcript_15656/g.32164 Transcript_15656/m.32164 type:complete len:158 (-) Transcript_15656:397-870(-)|eukprot:CAMPEP_0201116704 /NCGR_PEP_ID=MMETSP0850-20130426/897_1 /ASSEMBLY_ACC=CAM_ASM_000622 /TAXON_ID=183588 /ORGANISM="Pseudo-nitzschia fraudulenta, Strain WWA7" /LENGTH=157 /DNA_ID=CAMNT_0047380851 /DNA_START=55 /DNA_END=528 /DNA_ORIENTATION=-